MSTTPRRSFGGAVRVKRNISPTTSIDESNKNAKLEEHAALKQLTDEINSGLLKGSPEVQYSDDVLILTSPKLREQKRRISFLGGAARVKTPSKEAANDTKIAVEKKENSNNISEHRNSLLCSDEDRLSKLSNALDANKRFSLTGNNFHPNSKMSYNLSPNYYL